MDNRLKSVLRPRPKIGLAGVPKDALAARLPQSPASRPSVMQAPVLVLNATFEPINVTAVRRALVLMLKGVAQAEETNHAEVHTAQKAIQVPSVIRLLTYRHIPQQSRALSRKNILLRDRNTCQFCGHALPASELTLDHVMPRSRGGRSSWENLVACCYGVQQPQRRSHARRSRTQTSAPPASFYSPYFAPVDAPYRASRREMAQIPFLLTI